MQKPKADKPYVFVRVTDGRIDHTVFTRHSDGSAGFVIDGVWHCFELRDDVWKDALAELESLGFVELREAQSSGLVPSEWKPSL